MIPDSKVHGDNVGPIWGRQDPGGPHVDPRNFAIWVELICIFVDKGFLRAVREFWGKRYRAVRDALGSCKEEF